MKNILLLGGTGFIGKNIIESFATDKKYNLIILSRNPYLVEDSFFSEKNIIIEIGTLADTDFINNVIIKHNVDVIIHLLSSLIPSSSNTDFYDAMSNIVIPTFKLIDFIANKNIKFLFFSSGGTVYGNATSIIKETTMLNPINNYGFSKQIIEDYLRYKKNICLLDCIILRPSNVYGKYQAFDGNQGFIAVAINKIFNGIPIEIWGDGNTVRDYIHIDDVVHILKKIIDQSIANVTLNLSTGIGKSLLEIINLIEKHMSKNAIIYFNKKRSVDATTVILDNAQLVVLIPHEFISVDKGIKDQINYFNIVLKNAN
ncbi:NAD-dependent epimerase/dehydratase family protein [Flavobacterium sp. Sr18]|uniref:NAD-dependent epimerase/dehydratase family protein n=1 Tax=Flavobacterium sp. Sr18 TaxID=935222 RepID=UPI0013E4B842|nr:NAD-dependent epimerase/dehydratase family protein [Flavobacterium sp. Sr18]QIH39495.1 NAD-dependent epimerase/dehydratase family protein [Flavobacterium sp. Sr18]